MSGGEVLEAEQHQFQSILYAHLLEQMRQINLHGAFGNLQGVSDLLVLHSLGQQRNELALALAQHHSLGGLAALGKRLFEPQFALVDPLQAVGLHVGR